MSRALPGVAPLPPPVEVFVDKGPKYLRMLDEQRNSKTPKLKIRRVKPFDLIGSTDDQLRACLRTLEGFVRSNMAFALCLKSRAELETLYFEHHPAGRAEWEFVRRERWRAARAEAFEKERALAAHVAEVEAQTAEDELNKLLEAEEVAERAAIMESELSRIIKSREASAANSADISRSHSRGQTPSGARTPSMTAGGNNAGLRPPPLDLSQLELALEAAVGFIPSSTPETD